MLKEENDAVAGLVVFIMVVGLVVSIVTIVQVFYVPKWMEEREYEHMEKVTDQFSRLSFAIDALAETEQDIPITTPITLGSKELGFLVSSRAYGSLAIFEDQFYLLTGNRSGKQNLYPLGSFKYISGNNYYLDQSLIYEAGAMIISQASGNVMYGKPAFSVGNMGAQSNISIHIVNIVTNSGKMSVGGYGTYSIRAKFLGSYNETSYDLKNFTIQTNYPYIWYNYLNSSFLTSNWAYWLDYTINQNDEQVTVEFTGAVVNIELKVTTIGVDLALG